MSGIHRRRARIVGAAIVLGAGLAALDTGVAHAADGPVPVNTTCSARFIENDGTSGGLVPPELPFPLPTTAAGVGGPTEVNAGADFTAAAASITIPVPEKVDTKIVDSGIGIEGSGIVPVWAASNIIQTFQVDGAAAIGTPTLAGGNVIGASVTKDGNKIIVKFPGTVATGPENFRVPITNAIVPGNEQMFVPDDDGSFQSPVLSIPLTAGAAGSTITFRMTNLQSDADVDAFDNFGHVLVRATCTADTNLLGAVQVVTPPPPGAPDAVADSVATEQDKPVTIDVKKNDVANTELAIDPASLAVTTAPAHGSATVNADGTITYTPAAGYFGGDSFVYKLCSVPPTTTIAVVEAPCDTATVTITVAAKVAAVQAPPTSAPPAAAAAAPAELPRTGGSAVPLALAGVVCCTLGGALVRARRHAH